MVCSIISCKTESKKETPKKTTVPTQIKNGKYGDLPPLPKKELNKLFAKATYVDYIFYNLPFAISQDDKPSISSNLRLIAKDQMGPIAQDCKPIGREFFHIDGEIIYEADIYFQSGCYGYVFFANKVPTYANKVSESGIKFYTNIIAQGQQIKNNAVNGG